MAFDDAKFQDTIRRFEEQAARASRLKEQIGQLRGSARNPDGSVTVTVAPSGAVLGLQLSPAAMGKTHTQLTQEILGAIRQATQQAAELMEQTVRPAIGDEQYERFQEAFRAHTDAVQPLGPTTPPPASALPAPPPAGAPQTDFGQTSAPQRPSRPQPGPDDDDGDFSGDSIFRGRR